MKLFNIGLAVSLHLISVTQSALQVTRFKRLEACVCVTQQCINYMTQVSDRLRVVT